MEYGYSSHVPATEVPTITNCTDTVVTSHLHFDVIHLGYTDSQVFPGMPLFLECCLPFSINGFCRKRHSRQRVGCDLVPITEPRAYHIVLIVVLFAYLRLQLFVVLPKGPYLQ